VKRAVCNLGNYLLGNHGAEFEHPTADPLVADNEATLRQAIFDIPVAESKPQIEPDGMADDIRRKSVPSIANGLHGPQLPHAPVPSPVNVMVWTAPAPASFSIESCAKTVVVEQPSEGGPSMGKSITDLSSVTTVGLDLAKHVFQVHGVDASGRVIVAKALWRKDVLVFFAKLPECLVGMEACSSAHHWARELIKLGHDARMMPPAYVKPFVRRQKNDAADPPRSAKP
jgi:hypothetical protein